MLNLGLSPQTRWTACTEVAMHEEHHFLLYGTSHQPDLQTLIPLF